MSTHRPAHATQKPLAPSLNRPTAAVQPAVTQAGRAPAPEGAPSAEGPAAPWSALEARPFRALQRKRAPNAAEPGAEAAADTGAPTSDGPLPAPVQAKMERSFNADFSDVQIHTDSPAAGAIGAHAFTQGEEVHFAPGQYDPGSQSGQALIGHELSHVVQQREGRVKAPMQARGLPVEDDPGLEHQADVEGERAAKGEAARGEDSAPSVAGGALATGPVQAKKDVSAELDWENATEVRSLHNDHHVYKVSWGGDHVVAKIQGSGASFKEVTLSTLAGKAGFNTAKSRLVATRSEEGDACLSKIADTLDPGDQKKMKMHMTNYGTSIMLMEWLEGTDIGENEAGEALANEDLDTYYNLGRLAAFQVFMSGTDRFALPGGKNFNPTNIRLDPNTGEMQTIDTDMKTTATQVTRNFFGWEKSRKEVSLSDNPAQFAKAYLEEVKGHVNNLLKRKVGQVSSLAAPMVEILTQQYDAKAKDIESFQIGMLEGLKNMAETDFDMSTLMERVRESAGQELLTLSEEDQKPIKNTPKERQELAKATLLEAKMSIAHGDNFKIFIESMQKGLRTLFNKNKRTVKKQLQTRQEKELKKDEN